MIAEPPHRSVDLAALVSFEGAARGLAAETFSWGRYCVGGRVGIGNVLGIDGQFGIFEESEWEEMVQIVTRQALQTERGEAVLKVCLRHLYEIFVADIRRAAYDGRVRVDNALPFETVSMMRSLGLITLVNYQDAPVASVVQEWVDTTINVVVGYPFDSGDHNILWLAIGGPRKGLPIAPRFQACDGHGACVILDRPETQPRGPIACRPASGAPGCILGAVCWRPWIDQTTTPRGYLSQVDTPYVVFDRLSNI